jgi:transcriptional regulator with XRE-family HTH domain
VAGAITGDEIRRRRTAAGLRQWQVARRVGLPRDYISNLETGRVHPSAKLSRWLNRVLPKLPPDPTEPHP